MTQQSSFWNRLGSFFRWEAPINGHDAQQLDPTRINSDSADGPQATASGLAGDPLSAPRTGRSLMRWGRRDASVTKRDGYERIAHLVDAMTEHFDKQDQRAEQLTEAVNRMASILEQLPDVQRGHSECMTSIASHLDLANRHAFELRETLARVPSSIQAQAEAIRSVSKQMEASNESDTQLVASLHRLGQVADTLGQAGSAQLGALQRMQAENGDQKAALTAMVQQQGQRFLMTMVVAGVLIVGALATMAVTLWMTLRPV